VKQVDRFTERPIAVVFTIYLC